MKRSLQALLLLGLFALPVGAQVVEEESYKGPLPSLRDAPGPFPPVSAELLNSPAVSAESASKPVEPHPQQTPEPGTILLIAELVVLGGGALFWRRCASGRVKS